MAPTCHALSIFLSQTMGSGGDHAFHSCAENREPLRHRERSGRPARSGSPAARRARSHVASAVGSSGDLGWQSMAGGDGEKNWQL